MRSTRATILGFAAVLATSCVESSAPPVYAAGDAATSDTVARQPRPLAAPCTTAGDCLSGVCLESEYGPPFCTRACDEPQVHCPPGPDAAKGAALCISFDDRPNVSAPPFKGALTTFCVPLCFDTEQCQAGNPNWETCDPPMYLGDPLYPSLGGQLVCQAPSYQGKDPVDPTTCDWDKTIDSATDPSAASGAQLCRSYCAYLERCMVLSVGAEPKCCEWGCFNQMIFEGQVVDSWHDEVKCYVDNHHAYPDVGRKNSCNAPPQECGGEPVDPTPPAAGG